MRRGRFLSATAAVVAVMLTTAVAAFAAAPQSLFSKNAIQQGYGGVGTCQPGQTMGSNGTCQCAAGQVLGANGACTTPAAGVAGAHKTVQHTTPAPVTAVAPATTASGTLPFTGLQLGIFVLIGVALIGGGLLVRRVGGASSGT
jgi:hypothetical protein